MKHLKVAAFLSACTLGMLLAFILHWYQHFKDIQVVYLTYPLPRNNDAPYALWVQDQNFERSPLKDPESFYYNKSKNYNIESHFLKKKIRVLCIIISRNSKRANAVKSTWAQHCNDHLFVGHLPKNISGSLKTIHPSSKNSFEMLCSVIHRISKNYPLKYDWTLIVEDKAFAIVENLRYFVATYNSKSIHYLGHAVRDDFTKVVYNLASAGIVLSDGALKYLHRVLPESCMTNVSLHMYDMALGELLRQVDVYPIDTRDHLGQCRFNSFNMERLLVPNSLDFKSPYWKQSVYLSKVGLECCSDTTITFNQIAYKKMFFTYYLVYNLHTLVKGRGIGNIDKSRRNERHKIVNLKQASLSKKNQKNPTNLTVAVNENDEGAKKILKGFESVKKKKKTTRSVRKAR